MRSVVEGARPGETTRIALVKTNFAECAARRGIHAFHSESRYMSRQCRGLIRPITTVFLATGR